MLRKPRAANTQATLLPAGEAVSSVGKGELSTCSMVKEPRAIAAPMITKSRRAVACNLLRGEISGIFPPEKTVCHAERSEASAFISLKTNKCRFLAALGMTGLVIFSHLPAPWAAGCRPSTDGLNCSTKTRLTKLGRSSRGTLQLVRQFQQGCHTIPVPCRSGLLQDAVQKRREL